MLQGFKYRLYPTKAQEQLINKHIWACRFIYNLALDLKIYCYKAYGKSLSAYELMSQIPELKQECKWLRDVNAQSLQQTILNMDHSFKNFFRGLGYPKFKNKANNGSFRLPTGRLIKLDGNRVFVPKFTEGIKLVIDRPYIGIIRSVTISKTVTGKYYMAMLCETSIKTPESFQINRDKTIGIDMGITHFAILSDGTKIENPRYLKNSIERLRVLQWRMRNKKKGSANTKKAYRKIALLHEKVSSQRKDFLHKVTTRLTDENQVLCLEDLNIRGMVKNHKLARAISDAGWGMFGEMIRYKSERKGVSVLTVPMFEPSTKICSICGNTNKYLTLSDRVWDCEFCGAHHDRDINASVNIKSICLKNTGKVIPVGPVEAWTVVRPMKQEVRKLVSKIPKSKTLHYPTN